MSNFTLASLLSVLVSLSFKKTSAFITIGVLWFIQNEIPAQKKEEREREKQQLENLIWTRRSNSLKMSILNDLFEQIIQSEERIRKRFTKLREGLFF